jgi:hypothetical protein
MKAWFKSRTIWLNIISTSIEVTNLLAGSIIPIGAVSIITNVGNIVLRFLTNQPVGNPPKNGG